MLGRHQRIELRRFAVREPFQKAVYESYDLNDGLAHSFSYVCVRKSVPAPLKGRHGRFLISQCGRRSTASREVEIENEFYGVQLHGASIAVVRKSVAVPAKGRRGQFLILENQTSASECVATVGNEFPKSTLRQAWARQPFSQPEGEIDQPRVAIDQIEYEVNGIHALSSEGCWVQARAGSLKAVTGDFLYCSLKFKRRVVRGRS